MLPVMDGYAFMLLETAIGRCGIAWSDAGIAAVQLPEGCDDATRRRLLRRFTDAREEAPPSHLSWAIEAIRSLLSGRRTDLSGIALDMCDVPPSDRRIYDAARMIPPGETSTYGEIASQLGDRTLAREVGAALGRNPFAIVVPCHRVLAADGRPGGFSANGGVATKLRILAIEGARIGDAPTLFAELPLAVRPRRR